MPITISGRSIFTTGIITSATVYVIIKLRKKYNVERRIHERTKYIIQEEDKETIVKDETLPSILEYFKELDISDGSSVDEANKKRTTKYYQLARDAHVYDLVLGIRSYPRLRNLRESEMSRIHKYWNMHLQGDTKSHRTVIAMCDNDTANLLCQARYDILKPLNYSTNIETEGVWIPEETIIPKSDMHVTVAIPWWWHTVRTNNRELSEELVARFKQTLVLEFHHAYQVELERIVLLGGKTLVALWRCVGERKTNDGEIVHDRHGDGPDPFVRLRRDIVRCFASTETKELLGKEPLTYNQRYQQDNISTQLSSGKLPETPTKSTINDSSNKRGNRPPLVRQNTIELKTPGLGDHDGFIHTTLARLPLHCLSMTDIELGPIHRLCREATASLCGHRLVISKFRFLETIGAGGESNPCLNPIFDETISAPPRIEQMENGKFSENTNFIKNVETHATIGAPPTLIDRSGGTTIDELFLEAKENFV